MIVPRVAAHHPNSSLSICFHGGGKVLRIYLSRLASTTRLLTSRMSQPTTSQRDWSQQNRLKVILKLLSRSDLQLSETPNQMAVREISLSLSLSPFRRLYY